MPKPLPDECPHSPYMRPEWCTFCIEAARRADPNWERPRQTERPNGKP